MYSRFVTVLLFFVADPLSSMPPQSAEALSTKERAASRQRMNEKISRIQIAHLREAGALDVVRPVVIRAENVRDASTSSGRGGATIIPRPFTSSGTVRATTTSWARFTVTWAGRLTSTIPIPTATRSSSRRYWTRP